MSAIALLACLLAASSAPALGHRSLTQQEHPDEVAMIIGGVSTELPTGLERVPPGAANASLPVYYLETFFRILGPRFVPFTVEHQRVLIIGHNCTFVSKFGPMELVTYREVTPNAADPALANMPPAVDVFLKSYLIFNSSYYYQDSSGSWRVVPDFPYDMQTGEIMHKHFTIFWDLLFGPEGFWGPSAGRLQLLNAIWFPAILPHKDFALRPVIVLVANVAVLLSHPSTGLSAEQASAVALSVEAAVVEGSLGTLVEVTSYRELPTEELRALQLEVTMFVCQNSSSTPDCEQQVLAEVIEKLSKSQEVIQAWRAAGIQNVSLAGIRQREPPPPVGVNAVAPVDQPWLPWHLDRIDQRTLALDGKFAANATGGVNVYIISSGVRGDHVEFGHLDGSPGSRVKAAWGFGGLDPLSDCSDATYTGYGMGTLMASLCCGLQTGAAKNATIYSVRFRDRCTGQPNAFADGGLTAGLDLVLSAYKPPAVVLIDAWFDPKRLIAGDVNNQKGGIIERLDLLTKANITMVAGATSSSPCENVIASHPGVIAVAPSGIYDEASGTRNGSCVDVWAPSGGPGVGLTAASSTGPTDFINTLPRWFGAAAIVVGVAAQYLELHPDASPSQVRQALMNGWASNHSITSITSPTSIIFTNFTQSAPAGSPPLPASTAGSGMSSGAIVGIAVAAFLALIVLAALNILMRRTKKISGDIESYELLTKGPGWQVSADDIEICTRPDGTQWLLGEGRYGKIYKALIRGVQAVAVRDLQEISEQQRLVLFEGMPLLKDLSRDANICQFYGACITPGQPAMLVYEFMEGGDLRAALSGERARDFHWNNRGKEIMLDILRAVTFLHDRGSVHNDICSKDVLLTRVWRAKLGDVGLPQLLGALGQPTCESLLPYTAPELKGGVCTVKSDVFSLGVLLWQLVTLEEPQSADLRPPTVPSECSQQLADIIAVCMQADPALRPTVRELYALLLGCPMEGEHLEGSPLRRRSLEPLVARMKSSSIYEDWVSDDTTRPSSTPSNFSYDSVHMTVMDISSIEFCTDAQGRKLELGSGAYGSVYKVLLDGVQQLAAKVLEIGTDPLVQQAFVREASTLWRLRHKNIVGLSGVAFTPQGQGLLLMELLERGSLYKALDVRAEARGERVFGWYARGKDVACDVASGLHYLHSMRTVHFDLKSSNVLLSHDLSAKLADVGLARVMTCTHHSVHMSSSSPLPGTFAYMAPELLSGCTCTQAVDVYSFGILLWEVCTGVHPVRGKMFELRVPQDCPQEVADLYAECTASDPAARPTARQLVQRLRQLRELTRERQAQQQMEGQEPVPPAARAEHHVASAAQHAQQHTAMASRPSVQELPEAVPVANLVVHCPVRASVVSPFEAMRAWTRF